MWEKREMEEDPLVSSHSKKWLTQGEQIWWEKLREDTKMLM